MAGRDHGMVKTIEAIPVEESFFVANFSHDVINSSSLILTSTSNSLDRASTRVKGPEVAFRTTALICVFEMVRAIAVLTNELIYVVLVCKITKQQNAMLDQRQKDGPTLF